MRWYQGALRGCGVVAAVSLGFLPATTASAQAATAIKTTLTASATSVTQDSWVTFRAQMTSPGGTSPGSVTFSDASNGSILGTTKLVNASTGAKDWSVGLGGTYGFSAPAYDGRTIFALNYDGLLTAFSASTGQELWATQMPDQWAFTAPPAAYDGVVYVSGGRLRGYVYAVSEADGRVRWEGTVENGDKSSPAVDDTGVYVSCTGQQDYRFSLSGKLVWHHTTCCEGGGGSTAVLHGSHVYARGAYDTPVMLSKSTGASSGTFASQTAPAFDSKNMYTLDNGHLVAVDPSGSHDRWSFGNGRLVTAPVVVGGAAFAGSSTGRVYAVSAATGKLIWTGVAGSVIRRPDEQNADVLVGMAVGDGLLVVPAGHALAAFGG